MDGKLTRAGLLPAAQVTATCGYSPLRAVPIPNRAPGTLPKGSEGSGAAWRGTRGRPKAWHDH